MNKKTYSMILREFRKTKDPELSQVLLISFQKLSSKDQISVLVDHSEYLSSPKNDFSDDDIENDEDKVRMWVFFFLVPFLRITRDVNNKGHLYLYLL